MTKALHVKSCTHIAFVAALMAGSSMAVAQNAEVVAVPVPVVQSTAQPAAETPVNPPPIVRTLPAQNDVVNPAALEEAKAEEQAKSVRTPTPRNKTVVQTTSRVSPVPRAAVAPFEPAAPAQTINEPAISPMDAEPVGTTAVSTVDDNISQVPTAETPQVGGDNELPLFAGIAALLAALGLGGVFVARRRGSHTAAPRQRDASSSQQVKNSPVSPAAIVAAPQAPVAQPVAPQFVAARPMEPKIVDARSDIPMTDPLFSKAAVAAPITDPLFAPRKDVHTPITDPLFANKDGFSGRLRDMKPAPTAETVG
ncbi:hypothetical protein [Sphingorhabdus sp.]|uniref:hypothetical protein n=1 Tax=Sphingorhabdus sp. TaxID=1902408 RepID=UPI0039837494